MRFVIYDLFEPDRVVEEFDLTNAPDWLTSKNTVKGSTMDDRWFWERHVITLAIGESVDTDFSRIKRVD